MECPCCTTRLEDDHLMPGLWCWRCHTYWLEDDLGRIHGPYEALAALAVKHGRPDY